MSPQIIKTEEKRFFSKIFDQLSEVEKIIRSIQENTISDVQLTLLVKLENSYCTDSQEAREKKEQLKTYWEKLLGPKTNFGFFTNREMGTIFIAGPLTELFLYDIDGKKLAELSEGPYGILRGLGIEEAEATNNVKKLKEGNYLLLVKGHRFDIDGLEGVLRTLDKVG